MKKLLVGSVFINDSDQQLKWLELQLKALENTTENWDHVVVLSEGIQTNNFDGKTEIIVPEDKTLKYSDAHCRGLNLLRDYFFSFRSDYEYFLFLDSDAFPIRKNWIATLVNKMKSSDQFNQNGYSTGVTYNRNYEVASIIRSENLETRLHASVLFVPSLYLDKIKFENGKSGSDLLCNIESDIYIPQYQFISRCTAFPLIRTNKTNVHHLACGVYYDMFYHHACGSGRSFDIRATDFYLDKILPPTGSVNNFT